MILLQLNDWMYSSLEKISKPGYSSESGIAGEWTKNIINHLYGILSCYMLDFIATVMVTSILCVSYGCESKNVQIASPVDTSKRVLVDCSPLVTHRCT